ncbi:MAG TPA: hypothetical protein VGB24_23765 [Longimicrobium sp.]|uniref:hypothetical protein n=1 Tax=Longimicrobium sp. TaxID=2029185 RepID=UPI002ED999EA
MSDFLFCSRPRPPGELKAVLHRWLGPVTAAVDEYTGAWGTLAVARAAHDPPPVVQDDRGITVLIGEPFAHLAPLPKGPAVDAARRQALHERLLAGGDEQWEDLLDGPFAALSIDPSTGRGAVVTDLFAWITVFHADDVRASVVAGTHADAVAQAAGVLGEIDPVSAVELMGYYAITYPRTLYPAVRQARPGCVHRFSADGWTGEHVYWVPVEQTGFGSLDEAAVALRSALVDDVTLAVQGQSDVGLLLSGGEDARAVLGAVPPDVSVRGFIYAEAERREVRAARRVARAYGVPLTFAPRPPGHDLLHMETVAAMVGTQNEFVDVHGYGLHASLGLDHLPVVLGGFSSDALLKADNVPPKASQRVRRGGKAGFRTLRPPALPGVRPELLAEAMARRDAYRRSLTEVRPESADEWSFIYPFSMRKYAANLHGNRRLWRSHEPYMSNPVVRIAAAVPQSWKVGRQLFYRAVRPLLARSWHVPHTRNRLPYFPPALNAAIRPLLGAARGLRALATGELRANHESWPVWAELVQTGWMNDAEARHPAAESPIAAVFAPGTDPAAARTGWPPLSRLALLQLAYLTRK